MDTINKHLRCMHLRIPGILHRRMDLSRYPLDLILVPLSICLTAGYHAFLWHTSKSSVKSPANARKTWAQAIVEGNDRKDMLGVQSLRNSLMASMLSASIAILINTSSAALANNAYNSSDLLRHAIFGSQTGPSIVLKFASASLLLLFSFLCSSMAVWCLVEANFLINAPEEIYHGQAQRMLRRGWVLGLAGNRALFVTLTILLWLFGPVPVALSSAAMVWVFYNLDFINGIIGSKEALF